jgi:hypothetical protein
MPQIIGLRIPNVNDYGIKTCIRYLFPQVINYEGSQNGVEALRSQFPKYSINHYFLSIS